MWLEICSDKQEDWNAFLDLCTTAFQDSAPFKHSHTDPDIRGRFLSENFKHLYKTVLSDGRAGLVCVKRLTNSGTEEIVYAMCASFNKQPPTFGDESALRKIDATCAEVSLGQDQWLEDAIHSKIRRFAEHFDLNTMYGEYHATSDACRAVGLSKQYAHAAIEALYQDGVKRGKLDGKKFTIQYSIVDDPRVKKAQTVEYKATEIAHLHQNRDGMLNCFDRWGRKEANGFGCIFVYIYPSAGRVPSLDLINNLRKIFALSSNL